MEYMNDPIECPNCDKEVPLGAMMCPHCGYNIADEMQEYMQELEFLQQFEQIKNSDPEVAKLVKKQKKRGAKIGIASVILGADFALIDVLMENTDSLGVIALLLIPILIIYIIFASTGHRRRGKKIRKICEQRYGLHYN